MGLPAIDMVAAGQAARDEQDHEEQRGGGEADDDGGEDERLRKRIGVVGRIYLPDDSTAGRSCAACPSRR